MHILAPPYARPCIAPSSIPREPVSTVIGLTALIASFGVPAALAGTIGGLLITAGFSVGAQLLAGRRGSQAQSAPDFGPEVRGHKRSSAPYKRIVVGETAVGGDLIFEHAKAPYLYHLWAVSAKQIEEFTRVWIGSNEIIFTALTPGQILTPIASANGVDYSDRLQMSLRLGEADQAIDPILDNDFTNLSAEFRQRGVATVCLRYHFGAGQEENQELWGGQIPLPYFGVRGVRWYDPRDATQTLADETSHKFTRNASLIQAGYLIAPWGGRISSGRMDWDKVAVAANYDGELFGTADGTLLQKGIADGVIALNQEPFKVINDLLSANRGLVLGSGGKVWVSSSKPRDPIATIHDGVLVGGIKFRADKPKRDTVNRLKLRIVAVDRQYQVVDGPRLDRTDLQTADQDILEQTLELPFTNDHRAAQRLQKAFLDASRLGKTLVCRVDLALLEKCADELIGNAVTFYSRLFPHANGIYLIADVGFTDDMSAMELSLLEYDKSIENDWIAADDEQEFTIAELDLAA